MDIINKFVITLVSTLILMSAVELISPDNSMKKYLKFVLGLILISVMLSPIIEFVNKGDKVITTLIKDYEKEFESINYSESIVNNKNIKEESLVKNINSNCERILKERFIDIDFTCDAKCEIDYEKMTFDLEKIEIEIKDNKVRKIEKIQIGEAKDNKENTEDDLQKKIKDYLSEELKISRNRIIVNYSEGG